jgi:hypothetical protein
MSALACGRGGLLDPATGSSSAGGGAAGAGDVAASQPPLPPTPVTPLPPAPVAGDWLMYGFEDPVAVHLEVGPDGRSYDVTGTGCFNGVPGLLGGDVDACGSLQGHGSGRALTFTFTYPRGYTGGGGSYTASVHASQDGTRMAGTIATHFGEGPMSGPMGPFGWLRIEDLRVSPTPEQWNPPAADLGPLPNESWYDPSSILLALSGPASLGSLRPLERYYEQESAVQVDSFTGALGIFWNPDFHWDEATRTLTAGPVPETIPGLPVQLELHIDATSTAVRDAVATLADGSKGTLVPVPLSP